MLWVKTYHVGICSMYKIGKLPGSLGRKHSKRIMELTKRDTEIERVYIAEGYVGGMREWGSVHK